MQADRKSLTCTNAIKSNYQVQTYGISKKIKGNLEEGCIRNGMVEWDSQQYSVLSRESEKVWPELGEGGLC